MAKRFTGDYFSILNKDGNAVIYRTDHPELNVLTFTIVNASDSDMVLKGGSLAGAVPHPLQLPRLRAAGRPGQAVAAATGSYFRFDFESMLSPEVVKNMQVEAPENWDKLFTGGAGSKPSTWTVGPKTDVTLKPKETVTIVLTNITCATTNPGNFEIMCANVPDYTDTRFPITKHLAVQNPVDPGKKDLPLDHNFINPVHPIQGQTKLGAAFAGGAVPKEAVVPIYITYQPKALIENGFTYFLTNYSKDPLVPASGGQVDADNPPVLYISFLFGEEDYDVTTQELADNNLSIGVTANPSKWLPMQHTQGTAYWQFNPQSPFILAANETVYFPISKIITALNVDPDKISTMYIQFNNVPGYNDANYTLSLHKKKAVANIDLLKVSPDRIRYGENVSLQWTTELAWRVKLKFEDRDGKTIEFDSEQGQIRLNENNFSPQPPPSAEYTKFVLSAYDASATPVQRSIDIRVDQPEPVIEFFKADPMLADVSKPAAVTLSWKVTNAQKVELELPEGRKDVDRNAGSYSYNLQNTTSFTLYAYGYGTEHGHPVSVRVRVYAYKPGAPLALPFSGDAMQNWPSVLLNADKGRLYVSDAGNISFYCFDAGSGAQKDTYPGMAMALSTDGSKLFVYNTDPAKFGVSIIDTDTTQRSAPVGFGPVYQMIATPNRTKLYCAATHGVNTVTRLNISGNSLSAPQPITVGTSPRAMVFNNAGSKLYVANYDSSSVSVIDVATDKVLNTIDIGITEPHSFAYYKDKEKLYVACEGSNFVAVIDTDKDKLLGTIEVGNRPATALISPRGDYLYVANFGANTVSVIETETDKVKTTLTVGNGPICLALNGDENVFFVGNYCSRTLSVVDINKNVVLPQALPTGDNGGNPFGLAVYAEKNSYSKVFLAKEAFKPRIDCATPNNTLEVTVYSIQDPGRG